MDANREGTLGTHLPSGGGARRPVLANVQVLRAISAFAVLFVHLNVLLAALGLRPFGAGGVDIFFEISGFLMVHTTRSRRPSAGTFLFHRIVRIVPIYWAITAMVYAMALVVPTLLQATRADPVQRVKSLLFVPFIKSIGLIEPVLFVGWTLNYEMFFYLLFAAGLLFPKVGVGVFSTGLAIGALVLAGIVSPKAGVLAEFYTSSIMLEFVLGMAIAFLVVRSPQRASRSTKVAALAVVVVALAWTLAGSATITTMPRLVTMGLPGAVALCGALLLERWGWSVSSPLWIGLGNASYSIYLTHPFVTQAVQKAGRSTASHPPLAALAIVATVVGAGALGWFVHRYVELPLTGWFRIGLSAGRGTRPAASRPV